MSVRKLHELDTEPFTVGRYVLHRQIARGGMATIHIARLMGDEGFNRIVAAKRLNPEFTEDTEFVTMFLDEARVASKVRHRNVVPVLDVVTAGEEVVLVQEYVHGVPLQWLCRSMRESRQQMPLDIAVSIACQLLAGLQATHDASDELGTPLHIVHRDVSPHNVMIAVDGSARLLDFGVAKAAMAAHVTREGTYKGKLAYSAPEQLRGAATRQSDIYSLAVLLWELLVGERMHRTAKSGAELVTSVLSGTLQTIHDALTDSQAWSDISEENRRSLELLEPIVRRGLSVDTHERWSSAAEMEEVLRAAVRPASSARVAAWLKVAGHSFLEIRERIIAAEEASFRNAHAISAARSSGPPSQDSFVNLRGSGRVTKSMRSDLIVPDIEASYPPSRMLVPASLLLAALALTAAVLMWRFGGHEPAPATPTLQVPAPPAVAAPAAAERALTPLAHPPSSAADPAPEPPAQAVPEPSSAEPPRRPADETRGRPARRLRPAEPRREPEPETATAPPPAAKPATDCTTPYYFDGSKKIFKPACL